MCTTSEMTKNERLQEAVREAKPAVLNGVKPEQPREHPTGSKHQGPGSTMRK